MKDDKTPEVEKGNKQKHSFRIIRRSRFTVLAKCKNCGLFREGTKGFYTYMTRKISSNSGYMMSTSHTDIEPQCKL